MDKTIELLTAKALGVIKDQGIGGHEDAKKGKPETVKAIVKRGESRLAQLDPTTPDVPGRQAEWEIVLSVLTDAQRRMEARFGQRQAWMDRAIGIAGNRANEPDDDPASGKEVFAVQEKRRIYHVDAEHVHGGEIAGKGQVWLHEEGYEADEKTARRLGGLRQGREPKGGRMDAWTGGPKEGATGGWTLAGYVDVWDLVTVCLTREAADRYIEGNRGDLSDPRVCVFDSH